MLYLRLPRLQQNLAACEHRRYPRLLNTYARTDLLVLDDWGFRPLTEEQSKDSFEILEDCYDQRATLVTSQLPIAKWQHIIKVHLVQPCSVWHRPWRQLLLPISRF